MKRVRRPHRLNLRPLALAGLAASLSGCAVCHAAP
jgi:hypothetical protein